MVDEGFAPWLRLALVSGQWQQVADAPIKMPVAYSGSRAIDGPSSLVRFLFTAVFIGKNTRIRDKKGHRQ